MKYTLTLSKQDLVSLLATRFNVDEENVRVIPYMAMRGYGMGEEHYPEVRVEIEFQK